MWQIKPHPVGIITRATEITGVGTNQTEVIQEVIINVHPLSLTTNFVAQVKASEMIGMLTLRALPATNILVIVSLINLRLI